MTAVFVLQNQHQLFMSKQGEWIDGREASSLYRSTHRDEALNQMVEANARDYTLRIKILTCEVTGKKVPIIKPEDLDVTEQHAASTEAADLMEPFETINSAEANDVSLFARGAVSAI